MTRRLAVIVLLLAVAPLAHAQEKRYTAPRTPWGQPDLQGVWTSDDARTVPLQRPAELGDRRVLTEEEFNARRQRDDETRGDVKVAAGTFVGEVGTRTLRQTSLVVSPPNGRVPARTPAADQRMAAATKNVNPLLPRTWEDRSLFERCISRGPLAALPTLYGNGLRIVQSPSAVVISHEMIHEARIIPTDGRAPVNAALKSYMGYATGRWDGDTLVIETTHIVSGDSATSDVARRAAGPIPGRTFATLPVGPSAKVTERLTRVGPDTVAYRMTYEDVDVFTAPWTVAYEWTRDDDYRIFEYACHERNTVREAITSSRALRAEVAEQRLDRAAP